MADIALEHADAMDAKAGILVTAASFIIAGVAGLQAAAGSAHNARMLTLVQALAYLAAITFFVVMVCGFRSFRINAYRNAPDPGALYKNNLNRRPVDTKLAITQKLLYDYYENLRLIKSKEIWLKRTFAAVVSEATLLSIILATIAWTLR